jgi:hypothetical protein
MIIDYPWKHLVLDNFLDENTFCFLQKYIEDRYDFSKLKSTKAIVECHTSENKTELYQILSPKIDELKQSYFNQLNFTDKELPEKTYSLVELVLCPPGFKNKNIHNDKDTKLMTTVLYITPDEGTGTILYSGAGTNSDSIEVEWKQNRALVFVGQTNTWHNYKNNKKIWRVTTNLILCDCILPPMKKYVNNEIKTSYGM